MLLCHRDFEDDLQPLLKTDISNVTCRKTRLRHALTLVRTVKLCFSVETVELILWIILLAKSDLLLQ